jgi:pimeloyl-ACP methyl ester carboxylesterase
MVKPTSSRKPLITKEGDIEIAYRIVGEGSPILLIMGYAGTMDLWAPELVALLAARHRVIMFDNRGCGGSTSSSEPFSIELFARDAAGLLDALDIKRADVLGFSMGSYIAQQLALDFPKKVRKLILYSTDCGRKECVQPSSEVIEALTNVAGDDPESKGRLMSLLFPPEWLKEHPDSRTFMPKAKEVVSEETAARQKQAIYDWSGSYERLPEITQPTLLVTGTEDAIINPANSFMVGQRIPGAWVIQLNGGHGLMFQYPKYLAKIVLTFLSQTQHRKRK